MHRHGKVRYILHNLPASQDQSWDNIGLLGLALSSFSYPREVKEISVLGQEQRALRCGAVKSQGHLYLLRSVWRTLL
jgi:hypothetical protein